MTPDATQVSKLDQIKNDCWDVVVIGAGVAGASFSIEMAKSGRSVLLIDSQQFPRDKVCGGCLNTRSQERLRQLGIMDSLRESGALSLDAIQIYRRGRTVSWVTPPMLSVRRSTLDSALVKQANKVGAVFVDGVRGRVLDRSSGEYREVELRSGENRRVIQGRMIVVAAGLTRSPISQDASWPKWVDPDARIGASTLVRLESEDQDNQVLGQFLKKGRAGDAVNKLHMLVGRAGYVGICETDGGHVDFAAALDRSHVRGQTGILEAVYSVLEECGMDYKLPPSTPWISTSALTRYSSIAAQDRVFLVGDSLGYVEPFTGEGMSWAFAASEKLVNLINQCHLQEDTSVLEKQWNQWAASQRTGKQSIARWVARLARKRYSADVILRFLDHAAPVRNMLIRKAMQ